MSAEGCVTVNHMKTTIHIPDALLEEARELARRQQTTLKALIEEGLRRVVEERQKPTKFKLRDASFGGQGLQPEFSNASWEQIRAAIYEGRGG
jgi:hypothetical protein